MGASSADPSVRSRPQWCQFHTMRSKDLPALTFEAVQVCRVPGALHEPQAAYAKLSDEEKTYVQSSNVEQRPQYALN